MESVDPNFLEINKFHNQRGKALLDYTEHFSKLYGSTHAFVPNLPSFDDLVRQSIANDRVGIKIFFKIDQYIIQKVPFLKWTLRFVMRLLLKTKKLLK